jgi:hypothetical protein
MGGMREEGEEEKTEEAEELARRPFGVRRHVADE